MDWIMVRLILVRHGETEWNRTGRYQGHTDVELSATGLWQVERLRDRLAGQRIDAVYSSDLKRALRTAQIITSKHNLAVIPCKELREIDFGEFEGMTFDEIQRHHPGWGGMSSDVNIPGGESLSQLVSRIELFISKMGKHSDDESVLIAAHSGSLQMLVCILLGIGIEHWRRIRLDSASVSVVESYLGRAVLSLLNDTCHLEAHST
jgi:alpha-ribazole phosphatase